MLRFLQGIGLKVLALAALIFAVNLAFAQTTPQEIKTDAMARKAIRLFNAHQPDSIYALTGSAFRVQINHEQFLQIFKAQFNGLLPFKSSSFLSSTNGINTYKVDGTIPLAFGISLDSFDKIENFVFAPYREEPSPATMTEAEKKTDEVAMKLLAYLNAKQPDEIYRFAGPNFRSQIDSAAWHKTIESQLYAMLPLSQPVFIHSENGVNKYKLGHLQYLVGINNQGKFTTWGIQPYLQDTRKTEPVLNDNPLKTKLDSVVNKWLSKYIQTTGNVGLSAAVYYKGTDHFYNYGETAKNNHQLPDSHTIYEIGSISKTYTATLLAKAVIDGLLKLDDPITKFLPDSVAANPALKGITLKTLSNHTSGLPRMPDDIDKTVTDLNQPYEHYDDKHLFAFLKTFKAVRAPGAEYEYSNLAVGLLGVILERTYHKTYDELLKQYITQPMQLNETKIRLTELDVKHLAQGYNDSGTPVAPWKHLTTKAAGAIRSTSADMLKYGKLQLSHPPNQLSKAFDLTHQVTYKNGDDMVGLGWHYLPKEENAVIQHAGGTGGYITVICVNLSRDIVVVVLTNNATNGDATGIQLTSALIKALPR